MFFNLKERPEHNIYYRKLNFEIQIQSQYQSILKIVRQMYGEPKLYTYGNLKCIHK